VDEPDRAAVFQQKTSPWRRGGGCRSYVSVSSHLSEKHFRRI
jgi:hypothetical protein